MTARLMLDLTAGEPDAEWLADLLAWELPWLQREHDRCLALVAIVAGRYPAAQAEGPHRWPALHELMDALGVHGATEVRHLLTVAVAGGWVRYQDVP